MEVKAKKDTEIEVRNNILELLSSKKYSDLLITIIFICSLHLVLKF